MLGRNGTSAFYHPFERTQAQVKQERTRHALKTWRGNYSFITQRIDRILARGTQGRIKRADRAANQAHR